MLPASDVVMLSRIQFGMTALYHFLFVPLTLGLSNILGIMETVYFITNRPIWRTMTQYWGILFGINVAWVWQPVLRWNFSLALTGLITRIMLVMCLVRHWRSKA